MSRHSQLTNGLGLRASACECESVLSPGMESSIMGGLYCCSMPQHGFSHITLVDASLWLWACLYICVCLHVHVTKYTFTLHRCDVECLRVRVSGYD